MTFLTFEGMRLIMDSAAVIEVSFFSVSSALIFFLPEMVDSGLTVRVHGCF